MGATGNGNYLIGGDDGDTLLSVGSNFVYGETGDDWLGCSGNNNVLNGAQGNDYLAATGNDNTLDGGAGNDTLVAGGSHAGDRFVFHPGYGVDLIANFSRHGAGGTDVIDLNGFGLNFNSLQSYLSFQPNGVAVITIDADTVLTIANGIAPNGFLASDFIF
jgi:Ca2+-binding RTX toxin-like protein